MNEIVEKMIEEGAGLDALTCAEFEMLLESIEYKENHRFNN